MSGASVINCYSGGNVDPLDPERHYSVEASSPMLEPVVRRTLGRGERPSARAAPISTACARSRAVEAVDDDILATDFSIGPDRRSWDIGDSSLQIEPLSMRELHLSKSGSNCSTQAGYRLAANT